ncbi:MAG: class I SAM-dependent methyltransferase [Candidatus Limnocylindria bacterium]
MSGDPRGGRRQADPRRPAPRATAPTSWDPLATWYDGWVGEHGSDYHRALVIPAVLRLLEPAAREEILDIGAGQGVLAPLVARSGARYTGVDASPRLVEMARRRHASAGRFLVADARRLAGTAGLTAGGFDAATFVLSIQDMDPLDAVLDSAAWALRPAARIVVLMTHPAFRIPRHSGWGWDEGRKLQFRRIDSYLSEMAVPMKELGGGAPAFRTRSFHRPLSAYVNALAARGFAVDRLEEVPDLAPTRGQARRDRGSERARAEIPLFLGLRAIRAGR